MFVDTVNFSMPFSDSNKKPSPENILAMIRKEESAKLRIYIGMAAGVGKTFRMLRDAHEQKQQGIDVVIGLIETHNRSETIAEVGNLEQIPLKKIEYRGTIFEELNVEEIIRRKPQVVVIDELAHTNIEGSKNQKRYQDVLEIVENGINVVTAVNIQHLESLNDILARTVGIRVRETVPDWFIQRADEVINIDISVDTLRSRLQQGKIYAPEKIEQALNNFFRKNNLSALRELALREVADCEAIQDNEQRELEGTEKAVLPEKVMVCLASRGSGKKLLRIGARIAGRLANDWHAVYVETPDESEGNISPQAFAQLEENKALAKQLGAKFVHLKGSNVTDELIDFASQNGITHVIFGQSARSRWQIFWKGSIINRFLREIKDATVQVVPISDVKEEI